MALTKVGGDIIKQPLDIGNINATTVQIGTATTIHTTGIDLGSGNLTGHNIHSTGIVTATSFVGSVTGNADTATTATNLTNAANINTGTISNDRLPATITKNLTGNVTGNVTGNADTASNLTGSPSITVDNITASGNVSIAGVLTYEDVTNIDSVGIITARSGIKVTSGDILVTGGDGRKISFASDGSAHYIKMDNTFNGPVINGYGGIKFETNGTNERLRITSTGVGINTTVSPSKVTIGAVSSPTFNRGAVAIKAMATDANCGTSGIYIEESSTDSGQGEGYYITVNADGDLNFHNSGAAAPTVTFSDTDNVGIGIANPVLKTHIYNTAAADVALIESTQNFATIRFKSATNTSGPTIGIDGAGGLQLDQKDTSKYIAFAIGSERLRITSGGNVNIGGEYSQTDSKVTIVDASRPIAEATLNLQSSTTSGAADTGPVLRFYGHSGSEGRYHASIKGAKENGTSGNTAGYLALNTRPAGGAMAERLRITSGGDIQSNANAFVRKGDGSSFGPHTVVRSSSGAVKYFEYYFDTAKGTNAGTSTSYDIFQISSIASFFQGSFEVVYGTRLQSVSDSVTSTSKKLFGVNRFVSNQVNITDTDDIDVDSNTNTHANLRMITNGTNAVLLRVTFSTTPNGSSFCSGVVRGFAVFDTMSWNGGGGSSNVLTFYKGV